MSKKRALRPVGAHIFVTMFLALPVTAHAAGDPKHGENLYNAGCFSCHDTSIHTRPNSIIFSKVALRNRVKFCDANAGTHWPAQAIDDVTEYLNEAFYKFDD